MNNNFTPDPNHINFPYQTRANLDLPELGLKKPLNIRCYSGRLGSILEKMGFAIKNTSSTGAVIYINKNSLAKHLSQNIKHPTFSKQEIQDIIRVVLKSHDTTNSKLTDILQSFTTPQTPPPLQPNTQAPSLQAAPSKNTRKPKGETIKPDQKPSRSNPSIIRLDDFVDAPMFIQRQDSPTSTQPPSLDSYSDDSGSDDNSEISSSSASTPATHEEEDPAIPTSTPLVTPRNSVESTDLLVESEQTAEDLSEAINLFLKALPLLRGLTDKSDMQAILDAVQKLPPQDKATIIANAALAIEKTTLLQDRGQILQNLVNNTH